MKTYKKRYNPPGTNPGAFSTDQTSAGTPSIISLISYSAEDMQIKPNISLNELRSLPRDGQIHWIQVQAYQANPVLVSQIGEVFGLELLALEDVVHVGQRPKIDEYDEQLFVILSLPRYENKTLTFEQISLFLKNDMLISFHDSASSVFEPVVKRLSVKKNTFRSRGADYLFYSVIDLIVDMGFPVLDEYGNRIESIEESMLFSSNKPKPLSRDIYILRKELTGLRRMLWPHRDVLTTLIRDEPEILHESTRLYLRDCNDHAIQIRELVDHYREMLEGIQEIYMSNVSFKLNDILRILTLISTMFIPLTFIAAIYGMNFDSKAGVWNMPELHAAYGYPVVLVVMLLVAIGMMIFFRKKNWL